MSLNHVNYPTYNAYLFVYFTVEELGGEQVYFSVSKDGLHWNDLNNGEPILRSVLGENGVRDPFIIRSPLDSKFYIIATDLRIASGKGWDVAQYHGSRSIMVWESQNLVNWTEQRSVEVELPEAGCVWAPESIFDEEAKEHLVFWASMVRRNGQYKQIMYSSRTKDFKNFSKPEVFIERENHIIDTTMIKDGETFYRYSKDETKKCIMIEQSTSLDPASFKELNSQTLDTIFGVEGPAVFKFNDRDEWCLLIDRFAAKTGYLPLVTNNLSSGQFRTLNEGEYALGDTLKRHGSVLNITQSEYQSLLNAWGL